MYLVDLPGYGYAKVSQEIKEKWGKLIERYLNGSKQLKAVFLLIDIRHEPSANDKNMYEWIVYNGYDPIIIATKLDKINRSQVQKHVKMLRTGLNVKPGTPIIPFSATTKQGRDEIWELIDSLVLPEEEEELEVTEEEEAGETEDVPAEPEKQRKPRWKATGKETAKKTKKLQEKKAAKTAARSGKKSKKK
jgi:GTP-binding protein